MPLPCRSPLPPSLDHTVPAEVPSVRRHIYTIDSPMDGAGIRVSYLYTRDRGERVWRRAYNVCMHNKGQSGDLENGEELWLGTVVGSLSLFEVLFVGAWLGRH